MRIDTRLDRVVMTDLKPCPFCRGDAEFEENCYIEGAALDELRGQIVCQDCGAVGPGFGAGYFYGTAVELWNTRQNDVTRQSEGEDDVRNT